MRRTDREVTERSEILRVLESCKVCRIGMVDGDSVYVLPLNFGYRYEDDVLELYFHSAREGKKLGLLRACPRVGFEMDCDHGLISAEVPCQYGYRFSSLVGNGTVEFLESPAEKMSALRLLMLHQSGKDFTFDEAMVGGVEVFRLVVSGFSCKRRP